MFGYTGNNGATGAIGPRGPTGPAGVGMPTTIFSYGNYLVILSLILIWNIIKSVV